MASHPYRQKMAAATPYPVTEYDLSGSVSSASPNSKAESPTQRPLQASSQLNRTPVHTGTMPNPILASPRFNMGNLASTDSVSTGDIPDIAQQLSKQHLGTYPHSNQSLSSVLVDQSGHLTQSQNYGSHVRQASGSSSAGSTPYAAAAAPCHSRSLSSTSSILLDRPEFAHSTMDLSQNIIQQHLGENNTHLVPRMKTIDLYRQNAKKSNDPAVLFQYAQYMLQTALLLDETPVGGVDTRADDVGKPHSATAPPTPPKKTLDKKSHMRSVSSFSNDRTKTATDPNLREALLKDSHQYLKRLSDKGYMEAQYFLGDAHSSGVFGKVDDKEAFSLFLAAAKRGHAESAFRAALCYEEGLGTGRDARKDIDFLKIAAAKNHPAAMYKLGVYFFNGRMGVSDTPVNKKMGIKWLERASTVANELTAAAPWELGNLYMTGYSDILIKDEKYALELYAQAAAFGHVAASAKLGRAYEMGEIVAADANLSIHYFTKAALGGDPEAMLSMCAWYLVGAPPYLPQDEPEAFEWAKRAAACNHPKGQFVVGNFMDKGLGCEKNPAEAQKWYVRAAENGHERALARITDAGKVAALTKKSKKRGAARSDGDAQEKDCVIM